MRRACWITLLALLGSATALADGNEADRLFEEGRTLAKAGKFAEACERFSKSLTLERTIGTELNLADCQEQLGHFREAWGLFVAAAGEAEVGSDPKRATFARGRATDLEPKMTTMIVKVAQPALPGLVITISGRATQPAPEIHERADPGTIDVIATAPGLPPFKKTEIGAAGATLVVEIPPLDGSVVAPPPPPPPIEKPSTGTPPRARGRVHFAIGLATTGGATAVTAVVLTLVGRNHYNSVADGSDCMHIAAGISCNPAGESKIHDAQRLADVGTVFAIGSALLVGGAAIVYLTAPRSPVVVVPTASSRGAGLVFVHAF